MENIVLVGAGGFGREVLQLIDCNLFNPVGFIDPDASQSSNLSLPILGDDSLIPFLKEKNIAPSICLTVGDVEIREKIFNIAVKHNLHLPNIIHPSAVLAGVKAIKDGVIIIDVGTNRVNGKLTGDVDFNGVYDKCSFITPNPGGIGPLTVAFLMQNTFIAYKKQIKI